MREGVRVKIEPLANVLAARSMVERFVCQVYMMITRNWYQTYASAEQSHISFVFGHGYIDHRDAIQVYFPTPFLFLGWFARWGRKSWPVYA